MSLESWSKILEGALCVCISPPCVCVGKSPGAYWSVEDRIGVIHDSVAQACIFKFVVDWIPAHCGLSENDEADELAKGGAEKLKDCVTLPFPTDRPRARGERLKGF